MSGELGISIYNVLKSTYKPKGCPVNSLVVKGKKRNKTMTIGLCTFEHTDVHVNMNFQKLLRV